ncbi:DUF4249 domain-containing protein [Flavobacteriaceae bacterium TP-CH-4]|uniref:DUF4249 domain-containing protein n=1 Tax=Pelagihabitans pacificus TaxID=2696054 RepID=A0A967AUW9_9FLAO|nr:DUF4249 domain-containing protein [Pelagihabitans pacificus]NHF59825.1 DUF4249 domain-containing protein [Pelagihabitans pacificus]
MKKGIFYGLTLVLFTGCIEPFDDLSVEESEASLETTLVVEASLSDEMKRQRILLSRPAPLQFIEPLDSVTSNGSVLLSTLPPVIYERNASVIVDDDLGNQYRFVEEAPGTYLSETEFAVEVGVEYTLTIETTSGNRYVSEPEMVPSGESTITRLYAEKTVNEVGEEGVAIFLDNSSTNTEPDYYRFDYEETYKIIAPNWNALEFALRGDSYPFEVITVPREQEERVCYATSGSDQIILGSTVNLSANRIERFPLRFLPKDDFKIANRYSLQVRQYSQSVNAQGYFEALRDFAKNENIFSQVQPGFIEGNISEESGISGRVIGYFEVVSVASERLFFNFEDFFEREGEAAYPLNCSFIGSPPLTTPGGTFPLLDGVQADLIEYVGPNEGQVSDGGPFLVTAKACGDCTVLGSNVVPEFWIEE